MSSRKRLLFVSPRALFPADSGGKIRTGQILRGLKGGAFEITLASPAPADAAARAELDSVCDRFVEWAASGNGRLRRILRPLLLLSSLPVSVASDRSSAAMRVIEDLLDEAPEVAVFDFAHSAVLMPEKPRSSATVMFTHNVEAEIFERQRESARNALTRAVWRDQYEKMAKFEKAALSRFDTVIAVSARDADRFRSKYGIRNARVIPTGTDLDFFEYEEPASAPHVVFTGSMDWTPNVDGVRFLLSEVWPRVRAREPEARMTVVGRNPPSALSQEVGARETSWRLTGTVPDIRPYVRDACVFAIPLRVGGGTRIKAFEAMALGCPVVSTSIGVEGLELTPDEHYLKADDAEEFADALVRLMQDPELRLRLSREARAFVEAHASSRRVAECFEEICLSTAAVTLGDDPGGQ